VIAADTLRCPTICGVSGLQGNEHSISAGSLFARTFPKNYDGAVAWKTMPAFFAKGQSRTRCDKAVYSRWHTLTSSGDIVRLFARKSFQSFTDRFGLSAMSASDPKRTLAFHSLGWLPVTILPFHPLLASLADSEGRLQARLTAHSQETLPCGRNQRTTQVSTSLALSEASEALAGRT